MNTSVGEGVGDLAVGAQKRAKWGPSLRRRRGKIMNRSLKSFAFLWNCAASRKNTDVAVGGVSPRFVRNPRNNVPFPLPSPPPSLRLWGARTVTMTASCDHPPVAFRLQRTGSRPRSSATWGNTSRTGSRGRLSPRNNCSRSRRSSRKGNTSALRRGPNSRPPFTSPRPRWDFCSTSFFFFFLLFCSVCIDQLWMRLLFLKVLLDNGLL